MNITQVCPRYFPDIGGVETHVQEISERLVKQGHRVEVLCTDPRGIHPEEDLIHGVRVRRFRAFAPGNAYFIAPGLYRSLKNLDTDIIHAHGYHAFPALFAAMAGKGKKFIVTPHYHGRGHTPFRNILLKGYDLYAKRMFSQAETIICDSDYERTLVMKRFPVKREKFVLIPIGINIDELSAFTIQRDPHRLLYVGRLEEYKGVQVIIEALPALEDYTLVIVGKGSYQKELYQRATALDVQHQITWKSDLSRQDLIHEYKSAGIFISLSSFEAFGITVAEALASGLQTIVNKEGALAEFVDGGMCRGIEPSAKNLVDAISSMKPVSSYRKKIFDWDDVVEMLIRTYTAALAVPAHR